MTAWPTDPPAAGFRASTAVTLDAAAHRRYVEALGDDGATRFGTISPLYLLSLGSAAVSELVFTMLAGKSMTSLPAAVHISRDVMFFSSPSVGDALDVTVEATAFTGQATGGVLSLRTSVTSDGRPVATADDRARLLGEFPVDDFGVDEAASERRRPVLHRAADVPIPVGIGPTWADATGDDQLIHLDDQIARSFGFERVVAHGSYTLAASLRTIVDLVADGDPRRVAAVRCVFARPVYPGDSLRIDLGASSDGVVDFRASSRGRAVLRAGVIELRDGSNDADH